jgi:MIP family channel proteins
MARVIDSKDWQKVLAEVVGTFFFFFIGIGSGAVAANNGGLMLVALAHGIALAIAISALGHISGGHFNPAVTISFMITRKVSPLLGLLYILGQLVGGVLACFALLFVLPAASRPAGFGTPVPGQGVDFSTVVLWEIILTFFLALAIFGTAVDHRGRGIAGFGIGLAVFVNILVGGVWGSGVMNPARSLAPALVFGPLDGNSLIYWIGPIIGAALGALIYTYLFLPPEEPVTPTHPRLEPPFSEPGLLRDEH